MDSEDPEFEPTKRQWIGFWSMIVQQTQNAFNDKAAQFILIPLGGAVGYAVESWAGLMIAIPFVLFAPIAGWMSDRFSKRNVIIGAAIAQVGILSMICLAVHLRMMPLALVGFFMLAVQSAFFSPAKIGINKELVGSKHLGFAAGVQQMMAMLAILAGQIVAGWWYDHRYISLAGTSERAWNAAYFPLLLLACCSVPALVMAVAIPRVPAYGRGQLSGKLLFSHFKDLTELWADKGLQRASLGVAYFWGFAAFINLWSVKVAKSLTEGGEGFGTMSSKFMAAASLGMVFGFGFASWLLRKKIELGWVPLAGLMMTACALILAFMTPGGWAFMIWLGLLAFSSACSASDPALGGQSSRPSASSETGGSCSKGCGPSSLIGWDSDRGRKRGRRSGLDRRDSGQRFGFDLHHQASLQAFRCQRSTVSGWARSIASRQVWVKRAKTAAAVRSPRVKRARLMCRSATMSCCRSRALSATSSVFVLRRSATA